MNTTEPLAAKLNLFGTLEWRDKDGNVLKTTTICGAVPLEDTGLTIEQAQELIHQQEQANGCHHSK
jgi:hypothetical protein